MSMSNSESRKRLADGVLPPTRTTKHRERLDEINGAVGDRSLRVDLTLLRAGYERAAKELQGKPRSTGPRTVYLRVIADLRALLDATQEADDAHDAAHAEFEAETARIMGWDESAVEALAKVILEATEQGVVYMPPGNEEAELAYLAGVVAQAILAANYVSPDQARELQREAWDRGFMRAAEQDHPAWPRTRVMTNPFDGAAS